MTLGGCEATEHIRRLEARRVRLEVHMIEYRPIRHHITGRDDPVRLCDGQPADDEDILIGSMEALREARGEATLCPMCQQNSGHQPFKLRPTRAVYGEQTLAYLNTYRCRTASTTCATAPTAGTTLASGPAGRGGTWQRACGCCNRRPVSPPRR